MSNPNGWGDGSVNNNIGWGQGANNSNGWGKSQLSSWSGATDIDGGDLPVNSVAPAITGTAQEGQTLTCSTGIWSGSSTYSYQWKRNGNNIGGATNSTYLLVLADVGQSILCTVTATNFVGSASANSNTVIPTSSTDADAQAFITAAAITDPTQQAAINTLVVDLKGYNIWTKMKAIYPFVGGSSSTMKFNLKDPRDLDVAFRLTYNGGLTYSSTGLLGGVNGYADTKLAPSTSLSLDNTHISFYSRTDTSTTENVEMGINDNSNNSRLFIAPKFSGAISSFRALNSAQAGAGTSPNMQGFFIASRVNSTAMKLYRNASVLFNDSTTSGILNSTNIFLLCYNSTGTPLYYTDRECAFASIGDGLTDTEAANFYTAVQAFQTALNRNV